MKREELQAWIDIIKDIESSREKEKKLFKIDERIDRYHYFLDFNEFLIYLPQELNQLRIMGERFLLSITLRATDVHQLYPIYCSLQESMKTFEYTQSRVTPQFSKLVAKVRHQAQERMIHGRQLSWKSENPVQKYAKELRKIVTEFEDGVNNVIEEIAKIDQLLEELKSVEMDQDELAERIEKI
jgi:DNA anti-recombination protein RmuC